MKRAKVEDHSNLERDLETGAILNVDKTAYERYLAEKEVRLRQQREIEELRAEIATLKAMMLNKQLQMVLGNGSSNSKPGN